MLRSHSHCVFWKGHLDCSFDVMDLVSKLEDTKVEPNPFDADALENGINIGIDSSISTILDFFGLELIDGNLSPIVCGFKDV